MFDPRAEQPDTVLFARVQAGDADSFAELVRRYQPALERVARSRLGRQDWAEDVVQETFSGGVQIVLPVTIPRFGFRTWLWTILLNQCASHYQRRMRSVPSGAMARASPSGRRQLATNATDGRHRRLAELLAKERAASSSRSCCS